MRIILGKLTRGADIFGYAVDFKLRMRKRVDQTPLYETDSKMCDIDTDPTTVELLSGMHGCAAAAEGIEYEIAFVGGGGDDALKQRKRLLSRIAETFARCVSDPLNISPDVLQSGRFVFVQILL